jgi:hypothetical protein
MEKVWTVGSSAKIDRVPSPSWRSRSTIRMRPAKPRARTSWIATAASLKVQKRSPLPAKAWWRPPPRLTDTPFDARARAVAWSVPPTMNRCVSRIRWVCSSPIVRPTMEVSAPGRFRESR